MTPSTKFHRKRPLKENAHYLQKTPNHQVHRPSSSEVVLPGWVPSLDCPVLLHRQRSPHFSWPCAPVFLLLYFSTYCLTTASTTSRTHTKITVCFSLYLNPVLQQTSSLQPLAYLRMLQADPSLEQSSYCLLNLRWTKILYSQDNSKITKVRPH